MARLPLDQGIPRFKANEERIDIMTNGDENATWKTSDGSDVPSVRKFLKDTRAEIDETIDDVYQARDDAQDAAGTAANDANAQIAPNVAVAVNAKNVAVGAKVDAESARDAAFINANVYPDVATGRAAVADEGQFQVVVGDEIVRYRRDSATTQTEVARYKSEAFFAARDPIVLYTDLFGAGTYWIDGDGKLVASGEGLGGGGGEEADLNPENYSFVEGTGYSTATQSVTMPDPGTVLDVWVSIGQSYTGGDTIAAGTAYSTTAEHPGLALMLSAGANPVTAGSTAFSNLVAPANAEPPLVSAVNYMVAAHKAKFGGTSVKMVGFTAYGSGFRYYRWKRGSAIWDQVQQHLVEIRTIAAAQGLRPVLRGVLVCGGESDATQILPEIAVGHIRQLRQDLQDEAARIFGQTDTVKLVAYANNRASFTGSLVPTAWPLALVELQRLEPDLFSLACPSYSVETDDTNHPTVTGYRELGALMGRAAYAIAYGTTRHPIHVRSAYWTSATTIRVNLGIADGGTLVRDQTGGRVGYPADTAATNYIGPPPSGSESTGRDGGWFVQDKDGAFGVVSAAVAGSAGINITLSRAGHVGSTELFYAQRSQSGGFDGSNENCARGVFRSSVSLSISGSAVPVYDWLPPQHIRL